MATTKTPRKPKRLTEAEVQRRGEVRMTCINHLTATRDRLNAVVNDVHITSRIPSQPPSDAIQEMIYALEVVRDQLRTAEL